MTAPQPAAVPLSLATVAVDARTLRITIAGDLDYDSAWELPEAIDAGLVAYPGIRELRLDCAGLGDCDSMGLSVLLGVHRATVRTGIRLFLDDRPPALERLLDLTGTLEFLTADPAADSGGEAADERRDASERQTRRPSASPPSG
ncbi:STAS domain-containing protein [Streptomyces sp. NBC_01190]|uniref:STAS domain-containing protein n=1 Tax=Streptomyces sp. NBC_01190 TaxID=2903767 RepID=UPI0038697AD6|nr:STAS domain-containing protein [Streptomyces sp. NBC_01190]